MRAYASTNRDVRYGSDGGGRLVEVMSDGAVTKYTYTDLDEMARIIEPDTDIENWYKGGRCVKQVNRLPGRITAVYLCLGLHARRFADRAD